ncbi:MAG: metallophosphoesterase [Paludibacteraceae bacterium]|nr:metallophosphoesterase [Paludibacteraceae bacterium]
MKIGITPFIAENIAPPNAKSLAIYNGDTKICNVDISRIQSGIGEKLYSFGAVSDIHLIKSGLTWNWYPIEKFDRALSYFQEKGCVMGIVSGDLTQCGYRWNNADDVDLTQMGTYKSVCDKYTFPVYELAGNHESYYNMFITNNLDLWEADTGKRDLSYTVTQGDDLFVFLGQPTAGTAIQDLQWLYETLEANRNRRCFVFIHPWLTNDSGNPLSAMDNNIFTMWQDNTGNRNLEAVFKNLLAHYKNTVLFHGHSHSKFENQAVDECANYTDKNGFKSIHIPSSSRPRDVDATGTASNSVTESQCCLVDVYDDYIVLNGLGLTGITSADIASKQYQPCPLGTFKINTPLVTVEANTFIDSTGTIK